MWKRVVEFARDGSALMVYTARNEQRLKFEVHGHDWEPVDFDGIALMRRQTVPDYVPVQRSSLERVHQPAENQRAGREAGAETTWRRREVRKKFRKPTD